MQSDIGAKIHGIKRSSFEYESDEGGRSGAKENPLKRNVSAIKGYCSQRYVCAREAKWTDKLAGRCLRGRRLASTMVLSLPLGQSHRSRCTDFVEFPWHVPGVEQA